MMIKYFTKIKFIVYAALAVSFTKQLAANPIEEYLRSLEVEFDRAPTREAKREIAVQLLNRKVIKSAEDLESIDSQAIREGFGPGVFTYVDSSGERKFNFEKTNPIMLAIALGHAGALEKFLSVIEDVNADELTAWGYRQPYYPGHMSLDPVYPYNNEAPLWARLRVVDLLASNGAEFNKMPGFMSLGIYDNPPLISAGLQNKYDFTDKLRARALLYGADPSIMGSSATLVCINPTEDCPKGTYGSEALHLCELAFDDYLKLWKELPKKRPVEGVKEKFREIKARRLKALQELEI